MVVILRNVIWLLLTHDNDSYKNQVEYPYWGTSIVTAPGIHPSAVLWRSQHRECKLCDYWPSWILLPALQKLYKLCSHPILLPVEKYPEDKNDEDEREAIQVKLDFAKVAFTQSML